jgi:hypothetical protein
MSGFHSPSRVSTVKACPQSSVMSLCRGSGSFGSKSARVVIMMKWTTWSCLPECCGQTWRRHGSCASEGHGQPHFGSFLEQATFFGATLQGEAQGNAQPGVVHGSRQDGHGSKHACLFFGSLQDP